jgi:hypothetical protein
MSSRTSQSAAQNQLEPRTVTLGEQAFRSLLLSKTAVPSPHKSLGASEASSNASHIWRMVIISLLIKNLIDYWGAMTEKYSPGTPLQQIWRLT